MPNQKSKLSTGGAVSTRVHGKQEEKMMGSKVQDMKGMGRFFTWEQFCEKLEFPAELDFQNRIFSFLIPDPEGEGAQVYYRILTNRKDVVIKLISLGPADMYKVVECMFRLTKMMAGPVYIGSPDQNSELLIVTEVESPTEANIVLHIS